MKSRKRYNCKKGGKTQILDIYIHIYTRNPADFTTNENQKCVSELTFRNTDAYYQQPSNKLVAGKLLLKHGNGSAAAWKERGKGHVVKCCVKHEAKNKKKNVKPLL